MSTVYDLGGKETIEQSIPDTKDLGIVANYLCEKALQDAKSHLHPLLQTVELDRLEQRREFLQAFKKALEQRIARRLAIWQPNVQAVFAYDATRMENVEAWDGSIHLLLKVPRLSDTLKMLGKKLDKNLVKCLKKMGWQRIQTRQSVLEVQQVTPNELRHAVGYGAMF